MARKRKAEELKESASTPLTQSTPPNATSGALQRIDWSSIDRRADFDGFTLKAVTRKLDKASARPAPKKHKTESNASQASLGYRYASLGADVSQENPYPESNLSQTYCRIEPSREWESTQRYRRFTIADEEFQVNQFVFVKKDPEDYKTPDAIQYWIAKVLEVRAGDAQHVYLRVYWAYRPEDLPGGRQPYHGDCELIVSNHMDVVDALCVQGAADVIYWDDSPDNSTFPAAEQLYWRQSLDVNKRKGCQITKLRTYCIDKKPSNPDEPLIQCQSCSTYLHAHCLEARAERDTLKQYKDEETADIIGRRQKKGKDSFEAEVLITDANKLRLTVTDKRKGQNNRQWDMNISCLLCKATISEAKTHSPTPNIPTAQASYGKAGEENGEDGTDLVITPGAHSLVAPLDAADSAIGDLPTNPSATVALPTPAPKSSTLCDRSKRETHNKYNRASTTNVAMKKVPEEQIHESKREKSLVRSARSVQMTPLPIPTSTSVFQSGVRSVARMLWKA